MQTRRFTFAAPDGVDANRLEAWQPFWADDRLPIARPEITASAQKDETGAAAWIENVMRTARDLMLASDLPCFSHLRLLRWAHQTVGSDTTDRALVAEIELPVFESYSRGTIRSAINEAVRCVQFMMLHPPSDENREKLWGLVTETSTARIGHDNRLNQGGLRALQAAYLKGVPFTHLGLGVYQLGWGAASRIINRSTSTQDSALSVRLTMFKHVNAELLRRAGLPAPTHVLIKNLVSAHKAVETIGWPLVVKPADLERGEGITTDVQPDTLEAAVEKALELSPSGNALVERYVSGVCYRIFVAQGQMLYAVERNPIGVYGDGERTISEIVEADRAAQLLKPAWCRNKVPPLDDLARATIASAGSSETTVPKNLQFIPLRPIESTAWGGTDREVTDEIHPENVRIAIASTSLCGLSVAGVDIITEDITRPWNETGAIINEVNFSPSLGSSEISRRHLHEYIDRLMQGTGRIPVTVFVGGNDAMDAAKSHLQSLRKNGVAGYLTSASETCDGDGHEIPFAPTGISARVRALVLSSFVEELVIVVQSDALLDGPLPLEGVDDVKFISQPKVRSDLGNIDARRQSFIDLMSRWTWSAQNNLSGNGSD